MDQCATPDIRFALPIDRPLEASFDAGRLTSDGGRAWLREAEDELAVCTALAAEVPEWRRGKPCHTLRALVTQRVFQIACGDEDQNDATTLRRDPLLKLVCGRLPCSGRDLASQPTLSRLENAVNARACYRLAWALGQVYLRARERDGVPTRIVLDLDGTDDPTHGHQEGSAYHGYYDQHQVPAALGLRRRHRPVGHRRAAPGRRPRQPRGGGGPQAGRAGAARPLAGGADRAADGQRRRRAGALRLLRTGKPGIHDRPDPQPAAGGAGGTAPGRGAGRGGHRRHPGAADRGGPVPGGELAAGTARHHQSRAVDQGTERPVRGHQSHRRGGGGLRLGPPTAASRRIGSRTSSAPASPIG
jgi:hypothetical protein